MPVKEYRQLADSAKYQPPSQVESLQDLERSPFLLSRFFPFFRLKKSQVQHFVLRKLILKLLFVSLGFVSLSFVLQ